MLGWTQFRLDSCSLARPGGNLTGVTNFALEVGPKRLELLAALLGPGKVVGLLLNPGRAPRETEVKDLLEAAHAVGLQAHVLYAGAEQEFEAVFAGLTQLKVDGLAISGDPFFNIRADRLGALSLKHALPTIYQTREFVAAGGLISYGSSFQEQLRLAGIYTGRISRVKSPAESAGAAADEARTGHKSEDRQDTRPGHAALAARPRRRGDRMKTARLHHTARRCGGVAARGAGTAACNASGRIPPRFVAC